MTGETSTAPPRATLPDFEDREVDFSTVRITNAGDGLSDAMSLGKVALHHGQEVYYVLKGKVTQINHTEDDKTHLLTRVHTVRAAQITPTEEKIAGQILAAAADRVARLKAASEGQTSFDDEQAAQQAEAAAAAREAKDGTAKPADVAKDAAERVKAEPAKKPGPKAGPRA